MRIFNYNPAILNLVRYYESIMNSDTVDGIFFNVLLDPDLTLKVYLPDLNQRIDLFVVLDKFRNSNKTIMLNILLAYQLLNDQSAKNIANFNNIFVQKLLALISRYPNTFYLASISTSTTFFLQSNPNLYRKGTIVTRADLGFVDVDFYVFSEYFINIEFIKELLDRGKDIFVFPDSSGLLNQLPPDMRNRLNYIITTPPIATPNLNIQQE